MENMLKVMPAIPTRGVAVFPGVKKSIDVGRMFALRAIDEAMKNSGKIFLVMQKDQEVMDPSVEDCLSVGVVARITGIVRISNDVLRIVVESDKRARLVELYSHEGVFRAGLGEYIVGEEPQCVECESYRRLIKVVGSTVAASHGIGINIQDLFNSVSTDAAVDILADVFLKNLQDIKAVMEESDTLARLKYICEFLLREHEILKIENNIAAKVKQQMDGAQRDYYLREQLKVIQKELGDTDADENERIRKRIEESDMPKDIKEKALKEFTRMIRMAPGMPETSLIRNYLEWLLDLPWTKMTQENIDIIHAQKILDRDHYGMDRVKKRILEYLAVCKRTGNSEGNILCLVGPPGVGKTSIAISLAEAMGKKYVRMSLGGVRDEAEIRGHRRTYVGAIPGRIIYTMKQAGYVNPLFLLDEIDKMSSDFKGDPASAMLEVLDKEQNNTFKDHYIEVPYDLSRVMFVTTANTLDTIPQPLKDRMEIIELGGYTDVEKLQIAKRHLLPKQMSKHGITAKELVVNDDILKVIISDYTREAGVRNLERRIADVCRYCVCELAKNKKRIRITEKALNEILRGYRHHRSENALEDKKGVATGLAWTAVGGETLNIETAVMAGSGQLVLTGSLGDVMKESATAALSIIRSNARTLGLDDKFHKEIDIHLHVPEGATPKDGPSAGVSILSSMVSALCDTQVRGDTAMTGEITLSGQVLPIGGLKEKSLAAYRAGITRVIIPEGNKDDIKEVPAEITSKLEYIPVGNVGQLLSNSLTKEIRL